MITSLWAETSEIVVRFLGEMGDFLLLKKCRLAADHIHPRVHWAPGASLPEGRPAAT